MLRRRIEEEDRGGKAQYDQISNTPGLFGLSSENDGKQTANFR